MAGCGRGHQQSIGVPPPFPRVLHVLPIAASGHVSGASMATDMMSGDGHPDPAEWSRDIFFALVRFCISVSGVLLLGDVFIRTK